MRQGVSLSMPKSGFSTGSLEVTHVTQQLAARTALSSGRPAVQIRPRPVEDDYLAVPRRTAAKAAVHVPASGGARQQSCGRSGNRGGSLRPQTPRFGLAARIRVRTAHQDRRRQRRVRRGLVPQVNRPHCAAYAGQVLRIGYLFMAQELRPRTVGRVAEVVGRALPSAVPAPGWLRAALPKERIPRVGVPKPDHVAGEERRAAASRRTRCGPGASGSHPPPRSWAGEQLSSSFRGRSNQRRMPNSL